MLKKILILTVVLLLLAYLAVAMTRLNLPMPCAPTWP